ncbi:MAG: hypothetical protein IPH16_12140 [Haliscomenobacter sp.]|nr:hypothetical protein [Haliscomenobacter sp.]
MKHFLRMLGLVLCLFPFTLFAQNTGDLAFVGFDADGNDNFAIVTFVELPANATYYFADKSWTGTAFATNEGTLIWNTGSSPIPAGAVIAFYNTSNPSTTSATRGTVTSPDLALSASNEGIFLFIGTDSISPTKFLAAVGNANVASALATWIIQAYPLVLQRLFLQPASTLGSTPALAPDWMPAGTLPL